VNFGLILLIPVRLAKNANPAAAGKFHGASRCAGRGFPVSISIRKAHRRPYSNATGASGPPCAKTEEPRFLARRQLPPEGVELISKKRGSAWRSGRCCRASLAPKDGHEEPPGEIILGGYPLDSDPKRLWFRSRLGSGVNNALKRRDFPVLDSFGRTTTAPCRSKTATGEKAQTEAWRLGV
jgi:hypothetical protein